MKKSHQHDDHCDLRRLFVQNLESYSTRPCLIVSQDEVFSYAQFLEQADAFATLLAQKLSGRLLLFIEGRNTPAALIAYIGALRAGHVVHLIDPDKVGENKQLVELYHPNVFVACVGKSPVIEILNPEIAPLHPDIVILLSTSGSTGSQKLVKLSERNVQSNTESIISYLEMNQDDRAITSLKFHYSYGLSVINTHLAVGASLVLTDLSIQEPQFWDLVKRTQPTNFNGVPYMFQMIDKSGMKLSEQSLFRFVTQAGGRLSPDLVSHFAREGRAHHWRFFVMYGQTEAAPRLSYVPPELVEKYPETIGVSIPGGSFFVCDSKGHLSDKSDVEGELVYAGPNVMMGYAYSSKDLATKEEIPYLFTGDLVIKNHAGLFRIIGRKARFVKPFGLRVNLDDVEMYLSSVGIQACVVGNDKEIVIYSEAPSAATTIERLLSVKYGLPLSSFRVIGLPSRPCLPNGKVDYAALNNRAWDFQSGLDEREQTPILFFTKSVLREFWNILTGQEGRWQSVEQIFTAHFPARKIKPSESFISLGGDSLLHIEVALSLEQYLGSLPQNWYQKSITELQALHA